MKNPTEVGFFVCFSSLCSYCIFTPNPNREYNSFLSSSEYFTKAITAKTATIEQTISIISPVAKSNTTPKPKPTSAEKSNPQKLYKP